VQNAIGLAGIIKIGIMSGKKKPSPEKAKEYREKYRTSHQAEIKERAKAYYAAHPEEFKRRREAWEVDAKKIVKCNICRASVQKRNMKNHILSNKHQIGLLV